MSDTTIRGQSGIDFIIGFGVFFLTLSFVLTLLPELLSPFAESGGTVAADRAADTLVGDLLVAGKAGTLDETCTEEFFDGSGSTCSFDAGDPPPEIVGVSGTQSLNVTVEGNLSTMVETGILCYDGTAIVDCASGGKPLERGPDPPNNTQSVRTVRRVVRLDEQTLWLKVRMW